MNTTLDIRKIDGAIIMSLQASELLRKHFGRLSIDEPVEPWFPQPVGSVPEGKRWNGAGAWEDAPEGWEILESKNVEEVRAFVAKLAGFEGDYAEAQWFAHRAGHKKFWVSLDSGVALIECYGWWRPKDDIQQAFELAEGMRQMGYEFYLNGLDLQVQRANFPWHVAFRGNGPDYGNHTGDAHTAPDAICLAASGVRDNELRKHAKALGLES